MLVSGFIKNQNNNVKETPSITWNKNSVVPEIFMEFVMLVGKAPYCCSMVTITNDLSNRAIFLGVDVGSSLKSIWPSSSIYH